MKPETKFQKIKDEQMLKQILSEARSIKFDFKRWGFRLVITPLNVRKGWKRMTPEEIYQPETYSLFLNDECIFADMFIFDLRKIYKLAKRYKHDHGIRKLRENIKEIIGWNIIME